MRRAPPADEPHGPLIDVEPPQPVLLDVGDGRQVQARLYHWQQWESGWRGRVEWTADMLTYGGWYPSAAITPGGGVT